MRKLIFILLFWTEANSQMAATMAVPSRMPKYEHNNLTPSAIMDLDGHSGTTIIEGLSFTNPTDDMFGSMIACLSGTGTIIIRRCYFGKSNGEAIQFESFSGNIIIEDNFFANNENGIYLASMSPSSCIIRNNQIINTHGAKSGKGQFVQFASCTFPNGFTIKNNIIVQFRGESYTEDLISMFDTYCNASNHGLTAFNFSKGGGPSDSGGGFMGGDTNGSYLDFEYNRLLNPGNYILGISGGDHVAFRYNKGYQRQEIWSNVGAYNYGGQNGSTCSNAEFTGNDVFNYTESGATNNYYYSGNHIGDEECGAVTGCGTSGDDDADWLVTNFNTMTEAGLKLPDNLITFVTEDQLWHIREEGLNYRHETADPTWPDSGWPASPARPTSDAGADDATTNTAYTLSGSGSGGSGSLTYRWVQVSGPSVVTMASPTSTSNVVNGLVNGVYEFRLETYDADGASDADWVTITKN